MNLSRNLFCFLFTLTVGITVSAEFSGNTARDSQLYESPENLGTPIAQLPKGRGVVVIGAEKNGFLQIKTKSGKSLWIKKVDLTGINGADEDIVSPETIETPVRPRISKNQDREPIEGKTPAGKHQEANSDRPRHTLTYDLSVSAGNYGGINYTELNLGVNFYFKSWLAWRNAGFYRIQTSADNFYGLDSSLRGIFDASGESVGLTAFAGGGYRFANSNASAPFIETGLTLKLGGLNLGGGVKSVLYTLKDSKTPNDTQYFVVLGGGGGF